MTFNDFLDIKYLSTFTGTVVVTMLMVQFLKELPYIKKVPTRYFTFCVAFLNILICSLFTNTFSIANLYLMFINAMLVCFTSTGGYDFSFKNITVKQTENPKVIDPVNITNDMK